MAVAGCVPLVVGVLITVPAVAGVLAGVDGDVVVLRVAPAVVPDCGTVPTGQGVAPSPPAALVAEEFVPGALVFAPGDVPGIAVVFIPGVCPGVVPEAVPGVTLGVVPWITVTPPVPVAGCVPVVVGVPKTLPAVAGVCVEGDVVVLMPGEVVVVAWPAAAGAPALVPAEVPAVCANTHVPASNSVNRKILRM